MAEIQQARWDGLLRRLASAKQPSVLSEVLEDAFPVIVLEDARDVELRTLGQWRLWAGTGVIPNAAGFFAGVTLQNPLGSGLVAVIEQITVRSGNVQSLFLDFPAAPVYSGQATSVRSRDIRIAGSAGLAVSAGHDLAAVPGTFGRLALQANVATTFDPRLVLGPGTILNIGVELVNTALEFWVFWRERPLEASEIP